MLSPDTKDRIKNWGKIVTEIMEFYRCDEQRAWQILAVDHNWRVAVVAEKIDGEVQSAAEKIDTVKRMKEEERKEKQSVWMTINAILSYTSSQIGRFIKKE